MKRFNLKICTLFLLVVLFYYLLRRVIDFSNDLTNGNAYQISINKAIQSINLNKCSCRADEHITYLQKNGNIYLNISKKNISILNYSIPRQDLINSGMSCSSFKTLRRGPNSKVISYSLFGKDRIYYRHLKSIIKGAKKIYPEWIIRVFHDGNLSEKEICDLECFKNEKSGEFFDNIDFCDIHDLAYKNWSPNGLIKTFWRWLPIGDIFVDYFLSRDTDSCLLERERDAVDSWLNSNKLFHIMRDHPQHDLYMLAGMWGQATLRDRNIAKNVLNIIANTGSFHDAYKNDKQADQIFLSIYLYEIVKKSVLAHDSFHCKKFGGEPFPTKRPSGYCHVGGYGCCGPESDNYNYSFPHECPHECRLFKDWVFC